MCGGSPKPTKGCGFAKTLFLLVLILTPLVLNNSDAGEARGLKLVAKDGSILIPYVESWAVIIGIDQYQHVTNLSFAVSDAKGIKNLLTNRFAFSPEDVLTLYDEEATKRAILRILGDDIPSRTQVNDRLFIYFAGHGVTRKKSGYLLPVDAKEGLYRSTAISMNELRDVLRDIPCKHIYLVLDACYSGMFFTVRGSTVKESHPRYLYEITRRKARQALTAGGKEPVSDEGYQGHSVFTGYFIEALEKGMADFNGDGIITASEIASYVLPQVGNLSQQTPEYGQLPGSEGGEFTFQLTASSGMSVEKPSATETGTTLSVETNITGARLLVDGRLLGDTPMSNVAISPGDHHISVEIAGYETYNKKIRLEAGRSMSMYVDLRKKGESISRLFVETKPEDAKVKVLNINQDFYQGMELEPGKYHVEVSHSGYQTKKEWVEIVAGEEKNIRVRLAEQFTQPEPGETWVESVTGMEFVWVPGGCFEMSTLSQDVKKPPDEVSQYIEEEIVHEVCIDGFWMGKHEVTQGQWQELMEDNPSRFRKKTSLFERRGNYPVENVTWNDAKEFIRQLNAEHSKKYEFRLPTEAEWEYACRAGTKTARFWGNDPTRACEYANVADRSTRQEFEIFGSYVHNCDDGHIYTAPVGIYRPNSFELYDMLGNVWEWCEDLYGSDAYHENTANQPSGSNRVVRGGSWCSIPDYARCAYRESHPPDYRFYELGFRVVREP